MRTPLRWRPRLPGRKARRWLAVVLLALVALGAGAHSVMIRMPGTSFRGPLPPLTAGQITLRDDLRRDVEALSVGIGPRCIGVAPEGLDAASKSLGEALHRAGYAVTWQAFEAHGHPCVNLAVERPGASRPGEIVVIGAHYDSCGATPGADDNASGVAALLALARAFAPKGPEAAPARTLRFVFFANEEPPDFRKETMGSLVYARACKRRGDRIVAMLSLETVGYYSDAPGSQHYPQPLGLMYPSTGNFLGFVGDISSRGLVRDCVASFRRSARFPSEGAALPAATPGVDWSDHWSFWQVGYPAAMVTDTAPFRNPHYHERTDTPDRLDYGRMARVVEGLRRVVADLAARPSG